MKIYMDKLHMEFAALNVDCDGLSLSFEKKPCARGHQRAVPL